MYRTPAEIPRKRLPILDEVTIKTPCRASWDAMDGDDRVRFCTRCSKNVYDLSAMTEDEAETFLATHLDDEDPRVRLYRRPDGTLLTAECSEGARARHARKAAVGTAAGLCAVVATSVAVAGVDVPDGRNLPKPRAQIDVKRLPVESPYDRLVPADELDGPVRPPPYVSPYELELPKRTVIREGLISVSAGLPVDVVRRIVRLHYGRFQACHEKVPMVAASEPVVVVRFVIGKDGSVVMAQDAGSTVADVGVVQCFVRAFGPIAFPVPDADRVFVTYWFRLHPTP